MSVIVTSKILTLVLSPVWFSGSSSRNRTTILPARVYFWRSNLSANFLVLKCSPWLQNVQKGLIVDMSCEQGNSSLEASYQRISKDVHNNLTSVNHSSIDCLHALYLMRSMVGHHFGWESRFWMPTSPNEEIGLPVLMPLVALQSSSLLEQCLI